MLKQLTEFWRITRIAGYDFEEILEEKEKKKEKISPLEQGFVISPL